MSASIFPLVFASEEMRLLTAVVIGFLFGFSLERAGFGNARKLAGQFYLYDMTVFKVMFTAVLVAMVGLYSLSAVGIVDLARIWVNPTFVWAQLIGGFLIGVGFIMSGLCPGTSVVSAASGRWDGLVTFGGIVLGSLLFAIVIDLFPGLQVLYEGGSLGTSQLPLLLGIPTPLLILGIVVMAAAAFVAAERVERRFQLKQEPVELTPKPTRRTPRYKFALAGSLALIALVATAATAPRFEGAGQEMETIEPLALAEALIRQDPNLVLLDLRGSETDEAATVIPGSILATADSTALSILGGLAPGTVVVSYDQTGSIHTAPGSWPRNLQYRSLQGGYEGWRSEVLTPAEPVGYGSVEREYTARQNQIAAFFSGAAVKPSSVTAPPVVQSTGPKKKKKAMGC